MNSPSIQPDQPRRNAVGNDRAARPQIEKLDQQKRQFRAAIEPLLYRAGQLGLNRVQIREIITSLR
jgi:hypothetical protein